MKITLKGTQLEITPSLETYTRTKLINLLKNRFVKHPQAEAITVDIELSREGKHHKKGMVFRAEINISLPPKRRWRIEESAEDIRSAIDLAETALVKKMALQKSKAIEIPRRRQRKAKHELFLE